MGEKLLDEVRPPITSDPLLNSPYFREIDQELDQIAIHLSSASPEQPKVVLVDRLAGDERIRQEHKRWLGSLALGGAIRSEKGQPDTCLSDDAKLAARGDQAGESRLHMNVAYAVSEAFFPAGHVTRVELEFGPTGRLSQLGREVRQVQAAALREGWGPLMRPRLVAESLNTERIDWRAQEGFLDMHWFVLPSLISTRHSKESAREAGYFVPTMTMAWQATTKQGEKAFMESAFMAGVMQEDAPRHDLEAIRQVYVDDFGITEAATWEPDDFVARPVLVPKHLMPEGVVNLAELTDRKIAQRKRLDSSQIYFGQHQPRGRYENQLEFSRRQESKLAELIETVKSCMKIESHTFQNPIDAVKRLKELIKEHGPRYVVENPDIDVRIFGERSARHIEDARFFIQQGEYERAQIALKNAEEAAEDPSGCPDPLLRRENAKTPEDDNEARLPAKLKCPKCNVPSPKQQVVVEVQGIKVWHCPACKFEVDVCTGETRRDSNVEVSFRAIMDKLLEESPGLFSVEFEDRLEENSSNASEQRHKALESV